MKDLSAWLKRGEKSARPRKALKRGGQISRSKRMRLASKKRIVEGWKYRKQRKRFLEERPYCEALMNAMGLCVCEIRACDVHHRAGRLNGNYLNEATWLPVCRPCHNAIHKHPKEAKAIGLLA